MINHTSTNAMSVHTYCGDQQYDTGTNYTKSMKYGQGSIWTDNDTNGWYDYNVPKQWDYQNQLFFTNHTIVYNSEDLLWEIRSVMVGYNGTTNLYIVLNLKDKKIVFTSVDYDEAEAYIHAQRLKDIL